MGKLSNEALSVLNATGQNNRVESIDLSKGQRNSTTPESTRGFANDRLVERVRKMMSANKK